MSLLATSMNIQIRMTTMRKRVNPPGGSCDDDLCWGSPDEVKGEREVAEVTVSG